ncbi:MAG: CdvA-like protein [Thermoproteota archaeon]
MSPIVVDKIIGLPVRDYLGRELGKVVCYTRNGRGIISKITALDDYGEIREFDKDEIEITSTEIRLMDKLLSEVKYLKREIEINFKRRKALEELNKSSAFHKRVYTELKANFDREREELEKRKKELLELANSRREEIARKIVEMQKIQAIVEVQAMSGELDDITYRTALSGIKTVMSKLSKEMELLNREFSFLEIDIEEKPATPEYTEQKQVEQVVVISSTELPSSNNDQVEVNSNTNNNVPLSTTEMKLENKKETEEKSNNFQLNNTFDLEFIKKIGGVVPGTPETSSEDKQNKNAKGYEEPIHVKVDG